MIYDALVDTNIGIQYNNNRGVTIEKIPKAVFTKEFKEEAWDRLFGAK